MAPDERLHKYPSTPIAKLECGGAGWRAKIDSESQMRLLLIVVAP